MSCRGVEGFGYDGGKEVRVDPDGRWLAGRINGPNLEESQRIWRLVDGDYIPIDWQRDFKSGYRWSESVWYLDIRYGHKPGVDIKVPWELARMQHLAQLAWAYVLARMDSRGFASPQRYWREFRSQVLDFIATNPPRFGVNWRSAMEVAIRAANWAVAADLFRAAGADFDDPFQMVLARSLFEHGLHIEANLEWDPQVRGNHYLANIAGLLFIAAYLPRTPKTDAWLAFAIQELVRECDFQFAADGTHREASTSYHCLAAEMIAYATALVLALPPHRLEALKRYDHRLMTCRPALAAAPIPLYRSACGEALTPFPQWYIERLQRMGEFAAHLTKPDGRLAQIGDNDSGRFFRFDAAYERMTVAQARDHYDNLQQYADLPDDAPYWDESHLDHRGLIGAIGVLTGRDDLIMAAGEGSLEAEVIRGLGTAFVSDSGSPRPSIPQAQTIEPDGADRIASLHQELCAQGATLSYEFPAHAGSDLRDGMACCGYPQFGIYVFRSPRLYLAVRCGSFGLVGNGGHAHHDQLSIELWLDGRDLILDPGTCLYTALKYRRDEYRGASAHFAPQVEGHEAQGTGPGLFEMRDRAHAECLYFGPRGFAGCHRAFGPTVYRIIEIGAHAVSVTDGIKGEGRLRQLTLDCGWRCGWRESPRYSPGYGIVVKDRAA